MIGKRCGGMIKTLIYGDGDAKKELYGIEVEAATATGDNECLPIFLLSHTPVGVLGRPGVETTVIRHITRVHCV